MPGRGVSISGISTIYRTSAVPDRLFLRAPIHRCFSASGKCPHKLRQPYRSPYCLPAYPAVRAFLPHKRIFASVCKMPISQGSVCAILERFSAKAEPAYQLVKEAVRESKVIGADETGMNQNGKLGWFRALQSKVVTFISYSTTRGQRLFWPISRMAFQMRH